MTTDSRGVPAVESASVNSIVKEVVELLQPRAAELNVKLEVSLGDSRHVLEEGDSIEYATSTPHRTENIGNGRAEVMWIIAPPTSGGEELDQYVSW